MNSCLTITAGHFGLFCFSFGYTFVKVDISVFGYAFGLF